MILNAKVSDRVIVLNSPVNLIDPLGLRTSDDWRRKRLVKCIKKFENSQNNRDSKCQSNDVFADCLRQIEKDEDLNGDGEIDNWDEMEWFFFRRLLDIITPPGTTYPPGYYDDGPGSTDPILENPEPIRPTA